tara:strand:- start:289 stop:501 length:213 start_codon:yes stop_codon:yes gene_type:complete
MNQSNLNTFIKIDSKTDVKIDKRLSIFYKRSDNWQESEKGEEYRNKTKYLMEFSDQLKITIKSLKTYLDI